MEKALGVRFQANGRVRNPDHRGWLRSRLRQLLEGFQTNDEAQRWIEAATFKARRKDRSMAYFAGLVRDATADRNLLDPARLLSAKEHSDWLRERASVKAGGCSGH